MRVLRGEIRDDIDLVAFGPGERVAAAALGRDRVDVWDAATGRQADAWQARGSRVTDLGFLADGRVLACADGHPLQVIDPDQTGRYGTEFPGDSGGRQLGGAARVAVAGDAVFTTHGPGRVVCRRPDPAGAFAVAWSHSADGGLFGLAATPDGRLVAHAETVRPRFGLGRATSVLVLRDAADGTERRRVTKGVAGPWYTGDRLRLFPDGSNLLAVRRAGNVVWDAATGKPVGHLPADTTDAALHPSGRWLLTSSTDGAVRVWDADRLAEVSAFRWDVGKLRAVAVSPDGALAAAGGADGRVVVWDLDL